MSKEIDERIVQMKFESGQFEKNVQTSIHSLEELKKGLNFKDATKGLENIDKASKGLKFDGLAAGIEALNNRFTLLGITGLNVMNRIANAAINAGEQMVKSLSTDQISAGFSKYADKTAAVQTIMSATAKEFTDTGKQMEFVNTQLEKLNWFTDETSYNFLDMVSNIGKFTSNNIPLDQSVTSMQGIATWAAQAGANAGEASRAMYNLSQAISVGSVKLIDWKSIENANMATASFKETVLEVAAAEGTLIKQGDKFVTALKGSEVSVSNFSESLSEGWFNSQVLLKTLDKYGGAANALNRIVDETGVTTSTLIGYIDDYTSGTLDLSNAAEEMGLSLEQTKDIMELFQDETMQFGLKAFKSAQEAKTFSEAISSVKDAVSSGWMQTFEYIFGDYEEAKVLWTDVANILYDLFAESGNVRNEMLSIWAEMGGREKLLGSFYNILGSILHILAPIKKAWRSVFPPQTAETLLALTDRFAAFTEKMKISEKTMNTIETGFRGLFTILDTLKFVVGSGLKSAFSVFQRVLAELNLDVGGFLAKFTAGTEKLNKYVKTQTWATRAIENFGDILVAGIRHIKNFISAIEQFGPVQSVITAFKSLFTSDFNGISNVVTFVGNVIAAFFELIATAPFPQSLSDIKQFFSDFSASIKEELDNAEIDFSAFEKMLGSGWVSMTKLVEAFISAVGMAGSTVGSVINALKEQLKEVDWSGVALMATGIAIVAMIYKIADAIVAVSNSLLAFTNIGKSIQGVLGGVKSVLTSTAKVIDAAKWAVYGAAMFEIAAAFGILAGSLIALSKVPADDLHNVSFYLGSLGAVLIGFVVTLGKTKSIPQVSAVLLSFAATMATFVYAMNEIDVSNPKAVTSKMMILGTMILALVFVSYLMGKYVKPIQVGAMSLLGIIASLYLMIGVLKKIGEEDPKKMMAATLVASVMMLVLTGISRLLTKVKVLEKDQKAIKSGGVLKLIGLMLSLWLLIGVLKKLGNEDMGVILRGVFALIPIMLSLGILFKAVKGVSKEAAGAGTLLLGAAAALYILVGVIKSLSEAPIGDIIKGGLVIIAIEKFAFAPLIEAAKYSGQNAGKVALMLLGMAGALAIIQMVVKTLGKLDAATLAKGTAAVAVLVYSFTPMVKALSNKGNADALKQLKWLLIMVAAMGAVVLLLAKFTDPTSALAAAASMSAVILSLGGTLLLMKGMKSETIDNRVKALYKMLGVVTVLALVLGVLANATKGADPKAALVNAVSLGVIMAALSASIKLIPKQNATEVKNLTGLMKPMLAFLAVSGLVIAGLGVVSKYSNPTNTIALATALGEIMIALSLAMSVVPKYTSAQVKNIDALMKPMLTFLAVSALVVGALAFFGKDTDPATTIALATALGEVMLALGLSMQLMKDVKVPDTGELIKMGVVVGAVGALIAKLSTMGDPIGMIAVATGIGELLLALGGAMRLMDNAKVDGSVIASIIVLSGAALVIGVLLGVLLDMENPDAVLPIAAGISLVLLAMSGVIRIISGIPTPSVTAAIKSIGVMVVLVGAMTGLLYVLGKMIGDADTIGILQNGGAVLKEIGIAIGGFVGGIIGGFVGGALEGIMNSFPAVCQALSDGTTKLLPMFDNLQKIPGGALGMIGTIVGMVAAVTAAEFVSGLEKIPIIGGLIASGKENMTENFAALGEALASFSESIDGVNAYQVKAAAEAVSSLASVQGDLKEGGLMGLLFGKSTDAFTSFAANVPLLGKGLKTFATETEGITPDSVQGAVNAAFMLVELEKSITPLGGLLNSGLFGDKSLSDFGVRITEFAKSLVTFGAAITGQDGGFGLNQAAVDAANNAGSILIALENSLPQNGGMIQTLFLGNKDLSGFGTRLEAFADGLATFSEKASGIDVASVNKGISAAQNLIKLESGVTSSSGGLWGALFGSEGNFKTFGNNLVSLGEGIRVLGNKASMTNFDGIDKMIEVITNLGNIGDLDKSINTLNSKIGDMISKLQLTIKNAYGPTLSIAKKLGQNVCTGITAGVNSKSKEPVDAVGKIAQNMISRFEKEMDIHSPSVVMTKEGAYVVKGIAEGIEKDDSAEEAAEKKAQNIVSAFQTIFDNADLKINFGNTKLESWTVGEGRGAGWQAQLEKDLEAKRIELEATGEKVKASYAKWLSMQKAGVDEQTIREAELEYLQMSNSYQSLRNEIIDVQIESAESMIDELDLLDQVREAEYNRWASSKEGKEASAAEKTGKELELMVNQLETVADTTAILWAKHREIVAEFGEDSTEAQNAYIKALNSEQKMNETYDSIMETQKESFESIRDARDETIKAYSKFIDDISPKLMAMGFGAEEVHQYANEKFNWDHLWDDPTYGNVLAEKANAAMERAHAEVNLVKDDLVDTMGGDAVDGITVQLVSGVPVAVTKAGVKAKPAAQEAGTVIGNAMADSTIDTYTSRLDEIFSSGTGSIIGNLDLGMAQGLANTASEFKTAAEEYASNGLSALSDALGEHSPSKKTEQMGKYLMEGLAIGIRQNGTTAFDAAKEAGDFTLSGISSLTTNLAALLQSDVELMPIITPVLDMDEIKNQSKGISGILNENAGLNISSLDKQVRNVSSYLKSTGTIPDDEAKSPSGGVVYNFTQNNYSPKALSKYDIYRQTNNQISQLKGAAHR